jgi:hypothetical protein
LETNTIIEYYRAEQEELNAELSQQYFTNTWVLPVDDGFYNDHIQVFSNKLREFFIAVFNAANDLD